MNYKFDFETPNYRYGTDCVKWDECPHHDMLPLWVADMDFRVAPAITEALERRARHGIFGYSFPGRDYYDAVIHWFARRHDWTIDRESIIYTTGVVPAISAVIKGLTRPGDGVVILTPVYTCFFSSIRNNECVAVESPLTIVDTDVNDKMIGERTNRPDVYQGKKYVIDWSDLDEKLSRPTSKIMLMCNPHNPGGRVWTADELGRVNDLCVKHNVILLSDEIHCEITMPGYSYTPIAKVATAPYVAMTSCSKAFNTAGLHIANIICPDREMREKINRAININETCDVGPFGIEAMKAAYNHGEEWLEEMISYVHENFIYLWDQLSDEKLLKLMPMEGSYLAWVDVKALCMKVGELTERLRNEANVWFHPGTAYGEAGEGFIRINLATSRQILDEAVRRFKNWLKDYNC